MKMQQKATDDAATPRIESSVSAMMLSPRETEKLVIYQVAELARRRRERGLSIIADTEISMRGPEEPGARTCAPRVSP